MATKDKRKPETIIRELRRQIRDIQANRTFAESERSAAIRNRDEFRARTVRAEQEAVEWKRRFDALLAAMPELRMLVALGNRNIPLAPQPTSPTIPEPRRG
jgi:FtsZ-binding cell division protein ZapB